jgi:phage terminase small subunit
MPTRTISNANKGPKSKPGPELIAGDPEKPTQLSPAASAAWDRLLGELKASGILITAAHRAPLAMAATISADIQTAWAAIQKDGEYFTTAKGIQVHPAAKRLDALRRDFIKVLGMVGLRAAVSSETPGGESLEDILDG